jgi:hypothetical protein
MSDCRGVFLNVSSEITTLYRPVGQAEFDLIRASGFREFPPRLPSQPFFYPVTNEEYATQIARDWNTKDPASAFTGYVLRFDVLSSLLDKYDIHSVGDSRHREYWIPAVDLEEFNRNVLGLIHVVASYKNQTGVEEVRVRNLGNSGGSDVANHKDAMIGESFEQAHRKPRPH